VGEVLSCVLILERGQSLADMHLQFSSPHLPRQAYMDSVHWAMEIEQKINE
jgi:hypothetical protein